MNVQEQQSLYKFSEKDFDLLWTITALISALQEMIKGAEGAISYPGPPNVSVIAS